MTRKGRGVVMVLLKKRTLLLICGAIILALGAVCALVLLDGVILCAMGVQGAYTQRIYDEVKGRPLYIIKERQS